MALLTDDNEAGGNLGWFSVKAGLDSADLWLDLKRAGETEMKIVCILMEGEILL